MENKRILLTGASGFLGSNLLRELLSNGYDVSIIYRSKSNLFRISDVFKAITAYNISEIPLKQCIELSRPDIIIHCATDYGRKKSDPSEIIEANLILPLMLLEQCKNYGVSCFINTDSYLDKGINYYSLSKKQFKEWLETYNASVCCVNIVLEHFYGAFDDKTKFVSYVVDELLENSKEIRLTEGVQRRNFIYIKDVVSAFMCIIKHVQNFDSGYYQYGLGSNEKTRIRDLVETIKSITGNTTTELNFGALPYRANEVMDSNIDISDLKRLGWKPKYNLLSGLTETINAEKEKKI